MGAEPVDQLLRPVGFGIGVIARAEHGHENLRLPAFSRLPIYHRDCLPGIVDEQLLCGPVPLSHHRLELLGPLPIEMAELAVAVPVRFGFCFTYRRRYGTYWRGHFRDAT